MNPLHLLWVVPLSAMMGIGFTLLAFDFEE